MIAIDRIQIHVYRQEVAGECKVFANMVLRPTADKNALQTDMKSTTQKIARKASQWRTLFEEM